MNLTITFPNKDTFLNRIEIKKKIQGTSELLRLAEKIANTVCGNSYKYQELPQILETFMKSEDNNECGLEIFNISKQLMIFFIESSQSVTES